LRYAISFDEEAPQIINLHEGNSNKTWEHWVSDNIIIRTSTHHLKQPREHTLKFWMVDPGVVLQRLVVRTKAIPSSYLGPPESYEHIKK
jgi:Gylcosyl hydrolase family 115 C-terminal domain